MSTPYLAPNYFAPTYFSWTYSGGGISPTAPGSKYSSLLFGVMTLLQGSSLFNEVNSFITVDPEFYPKSGSSFALVYPGGSQADEGFARGGGFDTGLERKEVKVRIYLRSFTDKVGEASFAVIDPDPGVSILALADNVKNVLHLQWPQDLSGTDASVEPLFFRGIGEPYRNRKAREWVEVDLSFLATVAYSYAGGC